MKKLLRLLRTHWGKALVTAIIGTTLTLAHVPPHVTAVVAKAGADAIAEAAEEHGRPRDPEDTEQQRAP